MYKTRQPRYRYDYTKERKTKRRHYRKSVLFFELLIVAGLAGFFLHLSTNHVLASDGSPVFSGVSNECLDNYRGKLVAGNPVDVYSCNDSPAQHWTFVGDTIRQANSWCLTTTANYKSVVIDGCSGGSSQVWLSDNNAFYNPALKKCLLVDSSSLILGDCGTGNAQNVSWASTSNPSYLNVCSGTEGEKVACYAERDWSLWQSKPNGHEDLLTIWTDNTPYEEWCADFVSYVYKQAGYPLRGAYDGWDENNANNLQNYPGFTLHEASSGYIPKAGDIAWFDYNQGHVEIVVSGGQHPTFVYGDSATVDPTTGNGQMEANTILKDGSMGSVQYYLSPTN